MHSLEELQNLFEIFTNEHRFNADPEGLYQPVEHIMKIKGKRIRPALLLMACDMFGADVRAAMGPAYAIEIFHNFTLVHDDIMDAAELRRGIATVHKVYGENTAILAGDVMYAFAYKFISMVNDEHLREVFDLFNKTAIEIFEGQQLDMEFEKRTHVSEAEYLKMIQYKTSVLLAAALQIGAVIGGADKADQEKIYRFGLNLGTAFQMKDDWLDAYGSSEKVGKRIGGDILNNKKTFLYIQALNHANEEQLARLRKLENETDEEFKIQSVLSIFDELDVAEKVHNQMEHYYQTALDFLKSISVADDSKDELIALAESIHKRVF